MKKLCGAVALVLGACATQQKGDAALDFYGSDDSRNPASTVPYTLKGDCDGFPRIVDVKTPPGLCLGLVDGNKNPLLPLRMPRAIAAYGDDLVVVDMAGWQKLQGQVFLLKKRPDGLYRRFLLLEVSEMPSDKKRLLYMPSTVQRGPDGRIWVGAAGAIYRFNPHAELFDGLASSAPAEPQQKELRQRVRSSIEVVLESLPYRSWSNPREDSLHPLKPFVFSLDGLTLFVGIGASTDNCGTPRSSKEKCAEAEASSNGKIEAHASVYRYSLDPESFRVVGGPELVARGLRNSLAMAIHPETGLLYQGENSRDIRGAQHASRLNPPDELNLVIEGKHYGWPYCTGPLTVEREYVGGGWDCRKYESPLLLLPPHSAPLQMLFYTGTKLPDWYRNKLLIPFHGREDFGHRLVVLDSDPEGRPTGSPRDVIFGWGSLKTPLKPLGSPMGIAQASDGSILLVEDKGRRIVRLSVLPGADAGIPAESSIDSEWIRHHQGRGRP